MIDDIIFENREKRYGAYFIRQCQPWHEWIALVLMCNIVLILMGIWQIKTVEKAVEKELKYTTWCYFDLDHPTQEYKTLILPPCPAKHKRVFIKIPNPVPAWKLCDCDDDRAQRPNSLLGKIKEISFSFIPPEEKNDTSIPHEICDCSAPQKSPVAIDSLLDADLHTQKDITVYQQPQLINPEVLPKKINRKLKKGKFAVHVLVDKSGKYHTHRIRGNCSRTLTKKLQALLPHLCFSPKIEAGSPVKTWYSLSPDIF